VMFRGSDIRAPRDDVDVNAGCESRRHNVAPKSPYDRLKSECGDAGAGHDFQTVERHGRSVLARAGLVLGLEAGLAPPACAQAPWPQDSSQAGSQDGSAAQPAEPGSAAETEVDMTGVDINNLDWSQLNIDASTLSNGLAAKSTARRAADGSEMTWSGKGKPNGASAVSVRQAVSPFWDTRVGADMTVRPRAHHDVGAGRGQGRERRRRAAILGYRVGGDHRPRRWFNLGQDRGRSPARSRPGAEQARHLDQQIGAAQRAIFADPAERLQT